MSTIVEPTNRNATVQVRGDSGTDGEEAADPYDHPQKERGDNKRGLM